MKVTTKIINQYTLPYGVFGCVALSNDMCVILGAKAGKTGRFLILNSDNVEILDYEIPLLKHGMFNYRGALYKTEEGFGCVLGHEIVEYDLNKRCFKITTINGSLPRDEHNRDTGPLRTAIKINKKEILVTLEDHQHMFKGRYFCKLKRGLMGARYDRFLYSMKRAQYNSTVDCSATYANQKILFHRCEYGLMLADRENDISELCEINNGEANVIAKVTKGMGRFTSDEKHLIVKTYTKPYSLQFYTLIGEKQIIIPLTPKRVVGNIDKRFLEFFDKFEDTIWMGRNDDVTQTRFYVI